MTLITSSGQVVFGTISGGGSTGSEKVIPSGSYSLDASAKTITLSGDYTTVTKEQIISIIDLTTGDLLYDSKNPTKHQITVATSVITYIYDSIGIQDDDLLQIFVNIA